MSDRKDDREKEEWMKHRIDVKSLSTKVHHIWVEDLGIEAVQCGSIKGPVSVQLPTKIQWGRLEIQKPHLTLFILNLESKPPERSASVS